MKAMVLSEIGKPLELKEIATPKPLDHEVLIKVAACGICRTDLHIVDGELPSPKLPLVMGHQIVGEIVELGAHVKHYRVGDRVGVPWLGETCGRCEFCLSERENLCKKALYTGYLKDGGFAEFSTADANYVIPLPQEFEATHAAPLLCAGLIGYRALKKTGQAEKIAFYGFGNAAHILTQVVAQRGGKVYAFTREGDTEGQEFAKKMGAVWAGATTEMPPTHLDAAIIFAPVGELFVEGLKIVKPGGIVVSAGIHMSDIPSFPYALLWEERSITSVANLTRKDGEEFFQLAAKTEIHTQVTTYPLEQLNHALSELRNGSCYGALVIEIEHE